MEYRVLANQTSGLIKSLRKEKGWTQEQLGKRVGVPQKVMSDIELRPLSVSFKRILQVMAALDVDLFIRSKDINGQNHE